MDDEDLLNLYQRASAWAVSLVPGASEQLEAPTPCDGWNVATWMNHMLDTQRYFVGAARNTDASLPSPESPPLIGEDPVAAFDAARAELLNAYQVPGVIEKTGPSLGIAFSDQLPHGWDLAKRRRWMQPCQKACRSELSASSTASSPRSNGRVSSSPR